MSQQGQYMLLQGFKVFVCMCCTLQMANLEEEVALLVGLVQGGPEGLADLLREGASFYAPLLPSTAGHTTATKGADTNSAHSPAAVAGSAGKDAQEPFSPPHKSVTTKSGDSECVLCPALSGSLPVMASIAMCPTHWHVSLGVRTHLSAALEGTRSDRLC